MRVLGRLGFETTFGRLNRGAAGSGGESTAEEWDDSIGGAISPVNPSGPSWPRTERFTAKIREANAATIIMPEMAIIMGSMVMDGGYFVSNATVKNLYNCVAENSGVGVMDILRLGEKFHRLG